MSDVFERSLRRLAADLREQLKRYVNDVAYYNRLNPENPIDPDPDGQVAGYLRDLEELASGHWRLQNLHDTDAEIREHQRFLDQMATGEWRLADPDPREVTS